MKEVFIDIRYSFSVCEKSGAFNGGNNYAIRVVRLLNESCECNVHLLCTKMLRTRVLEIFPDVDVILINSLGSLKLNKEDIFFNPHVDDSRNYALEIANFRQMNPDCKICLTVHDRRHRAVSYDKYDGLFKTGLKSFSLLLFIGKMLKGIWVDKSLKKIICSADQLFSVSNYSMQEIIRLKTGVPIKYYTPSMDDVDGCYQRKNGGILFLSAGRAEKNFVRSLLAFHHYVETTGDNIKMYATGLSDRQITKIRNCGIVPQLFLEKNVVLMGYVGNDDLNKFYHSCRFLMFTSKNEGFGLPVAEAIIKGMPSVVSEVSAMPEVIGSVGVFVDPKSEESISKGINRMMDDSFYDFLLESIKIKREILLRQIALDESMFVYDLLHI